MSEWQPIATAPHGELLLYFPAEDGKNAKPAMMVIGRWSSYPYRQPTHWMPIPPPPSPATR